LTLNAGAVDLAYLVKKLLKSTEEKKRRLKRGGKGVERVSEKEERERELS